MIKGDYDRLKNLAEFNECAEHHTPLEVCWYGQEKTYAIRCGEGHYPDAITRQLSLTERHKAGEELPEPIKSNVEKGMRQRAAMLPRHPEVQPLGDLPTVDLGTGELLYPERVHALIDYARKYDLDAYRGHVLIMYGKPYVSLDGYLFHAHQVNLPYKMSSRPLTDDERKQYRIGEQDHAWIAEIDKGWSHSQFSGLGIVTQEEMTAMAKGKPEQLRSPVVAAHPQLLAQKRAEWQVLRRAFPIGESAAEQEGDNEAEAEVSTGD